MSWKYEQLTGDLFYPDGKLAGTGYSGKGKTRAEGRNNPKMEGVKGVGPCPHGTYRIEKAGYSQHVGPVSMHLTPIKGTDTLGRSALMIHGNNKANDASRGCIILALPLRRMLDRSKDRELLVVVDDA